MYILGPAFFYDLASVRLKAHEIGVLQKALAQSYSSWRRKPRACVQTQGINPRGIMCLLDDVVLGVQAPREEPLQEVAAHSFFWWC